MVAKTLKKRRIDTFEVVSIADLRDTVALAA